MTGTPSRKSRRLARQKYKIRKQCQGQTRGQVAKALRMVTPRKHRAGAARLSAGNQMRGPQDAAEQLLAEIFDPAYPTGQAVQRGPLTPAYEIVTVTPSRHEVRLGDQTLSWHRTFAKADEVRERNEELDVEAMSRRA